MTAAAPMGYSGQRAAATSPTPSSTGRKTARRWSPHFIQGTDVVTWSRMLYRHGFAVSPRYWYIAAIASVTSSINLLLRWIQEGTHGEELSRVAIEHQPLFVIGHWRTGTTLLHEFLIQDPQFNYPDFCACFNPNHRLISERFFKTYATILAPGQRPMDNMAAGWDRPQEDEFALCLLGQPSTYWDVVFPQHPPQYPGSLDLSGLSPRELERWKRTLYRFLQMLTFRDPRRLVLKSPPHTARIPTLLQMFPDARFVHIVRDPHVVFPSTINLWKSLATRHGLQTAGEVNFEAKVLREYRILYDRLEEARPLLRANRFYEVHYEDFILNPVGTLKKVYDALELDGFPSARSRFETYMRQTTGYETNKYILTDTQRRLVEEHWGDVIERYGYA